MKNVNNVIKSSAVLVLLFFAIIPPVVYFFTVANAPSVTPETAYNRLKNNSNAILIDIQSKNNYTKKHITGSFNWNYKKIMNVQTKNEIPALFINKTLYLICANGIRSAYAVRKLNTLGLHDAFSVDGGIQQWVAHVDNKENGNQNYTTLTEEERNTVPFPVKSSSVFEQAVMFASGFIIKPLYMFLCLLIIFFIWHEKAYDLKILRMGLISFFIGESFCSLNMIFYNDTSLFFEYLHSYGMVLFFALIIYSLFIGLENRFMHFLEQSKKCALIPMCGECYKQMDTGCKIQTFFSFFIFLVAILSIIPFQLNNFSIAYTTNVFGYRIPFQQMIISQYFESKVSPLFAFILSVFALIACRWKDTSFFKLAELLTSFACGYLFFGFFRTMLSYFFYESLWWSGFWEEFFELIFIVTIGLILILFQKTVLLYYKKRVQ